MARITLARWQGIAAKLPRNYGKAQAGSTRCICVLLKMAVTVFLLTFLWERPSAEADWIEAMARSLSEGNGLHCRAIPRPLGGRAMAGCEITLRSLASVAHFLLLFGALLSSLEVSCCA